MMFEMINENGKVCNAEKDQIEFLEEQGWKLKSEVEAEEVKAEVEVKADAKKVSAKKEEK